MHIYLMDTRKLKADVLSLMEQSLPACRRVQKYLNRPEIAASESVAAAWLALGALENGDIGGGLDISAPGRLPFSHDCVKRAGEQWGWPVEHGGKPFSAGIRQGSTVIYVSISHSGGLAAAAVDAVPLGLDVQCVKERSACSLLRIAERFHPMEYAELEEASKSMPEQLTNSFYRLWTAKESVLKLSGQGISGGLDSFCVDSNGNTALDGRPIQISFYASGGLSTAIPAFIAAAEWK